MRGLLSLVSVGNRRIRRLFLFWVVCALIAIYAGTSFLSFRAWNAVDDKEANFLVPSDKSGASPTSSSSSTFSDLESLSSVDYFACCGLGHRLLRMSLAHYVAKQKGFSLRSFWGWCGEKQPIEVFSYLFRPNDIQEIQHVKSRNQILPFYNEVPGFKVLIRTPTLGNLSQCPCQSDQIAADLELYTSLRRRFRDKAVVDSFVEKNFKGKTVLGLHVRAGNGEVGDFVRKGRGIDNPSVWVSHVCHLLQEFLQQQASSLSKPVVLYIATDTPSMIDLFRQQMAPAGIPVLDYSQDGRLEEGKGVLFGESANVHNKDGTHTDDYSSCLAGWTNTLTEMFLLSHADVVIAGKPSSFSQTAPMSLAFGNVARQLEPAYCEVVTNNTQQLLNNTLSTPQGEAPTLQCYTSYLDWCCNYSTWIKFYRNGHLRTRSKEFVRVVPPSGSEHFALKEYPEMRNRTESCPRPQRGRAGGGLKDKCLPFQW